MAGIKIKVGETLSLFCLYSDDEGVPFDLSGINIQAFMQYDELEFTVVILDQITDKGVFQLSMTSLQTSKLIRSVYSTDIKYTFADGTVSYSDTFQIFIERAIT